MIAQAALDLARKLLTRRFVVWWKPRGAKKWKQVGGEYADARDAVGAVLDGSDKKGGSWKAALLGVDPNAADDDAEDEEPGALAEGISPENVKDALAAAQLLAPCPEFEAWLKTALEKRANTPQSTPPQKPKRERRKPNA